jgi:hypothetical protein
MLDKEIYANVLKLKEQGKSLREIGNELGIGKTTVASIIKRSSNQPAPVVDRPKEETDSPQIIITETSINDMSETDSFLKSLNTVQGPVGTEPSKAAKDKFLKSLLSDVDLDNVGISSPAKKTRAKKTNFVLPSVPTMFKQSETSVVAAPKEEKGELIAKITLNINTFPEVLKDYIKPNKDAFLDSLHKKSHNELSALMSTMDYSRSIDNTAKVMKSLTVTGAAIVEMGTKRFLKMRTDGFSAVIASIPELETLLKEIAMENKGGIISKYQSPTIRLTTLVITTLIAVDARNRANGGNVQYPSQQQQENKQPISQETEDKYNEL